MMKLKDFRLTIICCLSVFSTIAQKTVSGIITDITNKPLHKVEIYDAEAGWLAVTDTEGEYSFTTEKTRITLVFYLPEYEILEKSIVVNNNFPKVNIQLSAYIEKLSEVVIRAQKKRVFNLKRLRDVEETAIYAGKKTEVVLVEQSLANLASNNARQIYNQIAGLNIYQNDDAGLQLNIGGRGLDPNRTSNFNTRQNGYDISADVLGYPESYYTPPAEALAEIQVIRGAASLQYGTQFGGLINFKFKKPKANDPFQLITRNTAGSNGLYTNFTSISGTSNRFSYYTFFNYKMGDGFRPNSEFKSKNTHIHLGYQFNKNTKLTGEITVLNYIAQQAGGLTDAMFEENPFQSNRARNWFEVDWLLYNLKLSHQFSDNTNFTFNFFGLDAKRNALGFRDRRVDIADPSGPRDLISSDFKNVGFETRLLRNYNVFNKKSIFLLGGKYYKANNGYSQGSGTDGSDANFLSAIDDFPFYRSQSNYNNPNLNIAIFGENIFYLNNKLSITPGARFEYIKTESKGFRKRFNFDGAGNPIDAGTENQDITKNRSFLLLGVGASYRPTKTIEVYANISQNYRSITFGDINIVNPAEVIDENLDDETGFTTDLGIRGNFNQKISYDISVFGLFYNDRIDFIDAQIPPVNNVGKLRTNVGDARVLGIESLIDFNLKKILKIDTDFAFNYFVNTSFINSEFTRSIVSNSSGVVTGNKVPFVPEINFKTGLKAGYKNLLINIQYTYLSEQFTDATNAISTSTESIRGKIPKYDVLDFSLSYRYKNVKLEAGVNNLLDNNYFTRRATGYPGPGIIPSPPRNWYTTLQVGF